MKLVVIFNDSIMLGKLTRFFTGCYAYHLGWRDDKYFYDMHLNRRRRLWKDVEARYKTAPSYILEMDVPEVTHEYLEERQSTDGSYYGFYDYILFSLRPVYHFFGKSTRNARGVICSEMINEDMWACGRKTKWKPNKDAPPSPCDWSDYIIDNIKETK